MSELKYDVNRDYCTQSILEVLHCCWLGHAGVSEDSVTPSEGSQQQVKDGEKLQCSWLDAALWTAQVPGLDCLAVSASCSCCCCRLCTMDMSSSLLSLSSHIGHVVVVAALKTVCLMGLLHATLR
jgi:hypothetical protein